MARTCPSCGAEAVGDDAVHCHRCGVKLDNTSQPDGADQSSGHGDWRTAAQDAGIGSSADAPPIPSPRDPHGPHAGGGPIHHDSTNWAMGAHLSAFLGAWIALAFVGPLVVWLIKRDEDPFVERHARAALNFNLLLLIVLIVGVLGGVVLGVVTLGIGFFLLVPLLGAVGIAWIVLTIIATVKAANGQEYDYPFNINLVK